jgi:hypothetical protein
MRLTRNQALAAGKVLPFYIAVWGVDRHFGAGEGGAGWFDCTQVYEVAKVWDWRTGLKAARAFRKEYPTCRRGRGSVLGGTDTYVRTIRELEDLPDESLVSPVF